MPFIKIFIFYHDISLNIRIVVYNFLINSLYQLLDHDDSEPQQRYFTNKFNTTCRIRTNCSSLPIAKAKIAKPTWLTSLRPRHRSIKNIEAGRKNIQSSIDECAGT